MSNNSILSFGLFSLQNHLIINKDLIKTFGIKEAIFISNLIDKFLYFYEQNNLIEEEYFSYPFCEQINQTWLTKYSIKKCESYFQKLGILEMKIRTFPLPRKELYKINIALLSKQVEEALHG